MATTLFLQSEVADPYTLYETMLLENPVYWDSSHRFWAIYSYKDCKALLGHTYVHIPAFASNNKDGLNEYALLISAKLARLGNEVQHEMARQAVQLLFANMKAIAITDVVKSLIEKEHNKRTIDWVNSICKKLPVTIVLKSFGFSEKNCDLILSKTGHLAKIMSPNKSPQQIAAINESAKEIYNIIEDRLLATNFYISILNTISEKYKICRDETASLCVSNLMGLIIQSYDAGRGLLSNSLLQVINHGVLPDKNIINKDFVEKCVTETLRFDPPVHNTRRVAINDIIIDNIQIKKGQEIFIILAAANRDPHKFHNPGMYNIKRVNNSEHLAFGTGGHKCPANDWSVKLATETLAWLYGTYKTIRLAEEDIRYEPVINVRLPKNLIISLS